jgi:hypothetical protein
MGAASGQGHFKRVVREMGQAALTDPRGSVPDARRRGAGTQRGGFAGKFMAQ